MRRARPLLLLGACLLLFAGVLALVPPPSSVDASTTTTRAVTSSTRASTTSSRPATTTSTVRRTTTTARATPTTTARATSTTTAPVPEGLPPTTGAPGAPPPAWLVGIVPSTESDQLVEAVYVAPSADPTRPDVAVKLRGPVTPPSTGTWRLDVVTGDPVGVRRRASLVSVDGQVRGSVEQRDGEDWSQRGDTTASLDPSGIALVTLPLDDPPPVDALWVEIAVEDGPPVRTPIWSRAALVGTGPAGQVPSGTIGRVSSAGDAAPVLPGPVVPVPPGPVVSLVNRTASVVYETAVPGQLDGQQVTEAYDLLRIVPDFATAGTAADVVRIDHTAGTVRLVDGQVFPVVDKSGDGAWLVDGLAPRGVGGVDTVSVDLGKAADALGRPLAEDTVSLGVTRTFVLADGRTVTVDGVLGTPAWFATALAAGAGAGAAAEVPGAVAAEDSTNWALIAGIAAVAAVLVGLVVVLVRRRRRRGEAVVENPFADLAETMDEPRTLESLAPTYLAAAGLTMPEPSGLQTPEPSVEPPEPEPEPSEPEPSVEPSAPEPEPAPPQDPLAALSALAAELAQLARRLDQLGGDEPTR